MTLQAGVELAKEQFLFLKYRGAEIKNEIAGLTAYIADVRKDTEDQLALFIEKVSALQVERETLIKTTGDAEKGLDELYVATNIDLGKEVPMKETADNVEEVQP